MVIFLLEVKALRGHGQIKIILYSPTSEAGTAELSRRVADVHASTVSQRLKALNCPTQQKLELLDAIINTAQQKRRE
jgi:hypothetical protein